MFLRNLWTEDSEMTREECAKEFENVAERLLELAQAIRDKNDSLAIYHMSQAGKRLARVGKEIGKQK